MEAVTTGIWNSTAPPVNSLTGAKASSNAAASATGTTPTTPGSDSATISANDFLTLLVTEMQNQDPTADSDPNQYINQLVSVNSLEQLIDINQTLSSATGTTPPTTGSSTGATNAPTAVTASTASPSVATTTAAAAHHAHANSAARAGIAGAAAVFQGSAPTAAPGNLAIPPANPSAQRVASALNGRQHSS